MTINEKMEALHYLFTVEGWEVLKNHLTSIRDGDMIALSSAKRELPDDFYRGRIAAMTWFLEALPAEVEAYFRDKQAQVGDGQPIESLGHPYGPEEPGQPSLEGEDMR